MRERLTSLYRKLGRVEKTFLVLLLLTFVLTYAKAAPSLVLVVLFATWISGLVVAMRLARRWIRKLIWRLRNRLIVAYLFIAMVPIALILALAAVSTYGLAGQIASYLVNSELDRRTSILRNVAVGIAQTTPERRPEGIARAEDIASHMFPANEVLVRTSAGSYRHPSSAAITAPPEGWPDANGIVIKGGLLYSWAHVKWGGTEVVIMAPLSQEFLSDLVPGLGAVDLSLPDRLGSGVDQPASRPAMIPPKSTFMDIQVRWGAPVPVAYWETPDKGDMKGFLLVRTRLSAVLGILYGNNLIVRDVQYGAAVLVFFLIIVILFLIVELVSLVIGLSITRTITSAVHELYVGTRRVKEGDFSHRIPVRGGDQLAELGTSFNTMTGNLEKLIVVAKEKERLESELEIAREVQSQLFPKDVPGLKTLSITGVCNPARVVSGDYYDFIPLADSSMAFAIGDVAGKGISAALLMAAIQSTMRMQLTAGYPMAAAAGNGGVKQHLSTAAMVSRLNKQLYANTSPEKYATFYFALYDDRSNTLTYTNAGHLPPILLRKGVPELLHVNGTVVGAFPFSSYEEEQIQLASGDVLVAYTDGIIEPENVYGEMFGERRLMDLLAKNSHMESHEIIARVMEAVGQWTGVTAELQDDMTMLVARRP